jgi:phosphocarrier protein HPr
LCGRAANGPGEPPAAPLSARCTIVNSRGLHARAAAKLVRLAATFAAEVTIEREGARIPATSILGLMMLAAGRGSELELEASGPEAAAALTALVALIERGFDETD